MFIADIFFSMQLHATKRTKHKTSKKKMLRGKVIVFTGPSCSGKGVQSEALAKEFGIPAVSTGQLLRDEVARDTPLGKAAADYMARGQLVPNEMIKTLLMDLFRRSATTAFAHGVILDGAIREQDNLILLERVLDEFGMRLLCVVHLEPDLPLLVRRMRARGRADDSQAVFERKYFIYREEFEKAFGMVRRRVPTIEPKSVDTDDAAVIHAEIMEEVEMLTMKTGTFVGDYTQERAGRFFRAALSNSAGTDFHRRVVFLATSSDAKHAEFRAILASYGVEVLRMHPQKCDVARMTPLLFACQLPHVTLLAVFEEHMTVVRPVDFDEDDATKHVLIEIASGNSATIVSRLSVVWPDGRVEMFVDKMRGFFDMARKTSAPVFGWDDVFVVGRCAGGNDMTFHEMISIYGIKVSPRARNICKWLKARLYYKQMRNFTSLPIALKRPVDFEVDVYAELRRIPALHGIKGVWSLVTHVVNSGVFFKSADQRRLGAIWCPALNGGIPLTPKDDAIHEWTYLMHDVFHFLVRDLIFTGVDTPLNRRVYVAWRLMSEAVTIVLADHLVVDALAHNPEFAGYDFSKRCIYPLFRDLGLPLDYDNPPQFFANLRAILHANFRYCLLGDRSGYEALLDRAGSSRDNLDRFVAKYAKVFVGDYEWTCANYDCMVAHADVIRDWHRQVAPLMNAQTVDGVAALATRAGATDIAEFVFNHVFEHHIRPAFDASLLDARPATLAKTFKNYMVGQMIVFAKYSFVSYSIWYAEKMAGMVRDMDRRMAADRAATEASVLAQIAEMRGVYEEYLGRLRADSFITEDDEHTFREICPFFDPHYITFKKEATQTVAEIAARVFEAKPVVFGPLVTHDYRGIMRTLIQAGGGIVDRDDELTFCAKPGVMLLADLDVGHPNNLATLLIAGCCVETVLELVSHKGEVARLELSRAEAMDKPFFRVFDASEREAFVDIRRQKALLRDLYRVRKEDWATHGEVYNISNSGLKAGVVALSLSLSDWNKFFIARADVSRNGVDVRTVARLCHGVLAARYPTYFRGWLDYTQASYGERYAADTRVCPSIDGRETRIAPAALRLFETLGIDVAQHPFIVLAEFRGRLPHLSFTTKRDPTFVPRIAGDMGNRSIVRAYQGGSYAGVYE